jgi:predicted anti-sigma-YlaC factor YlaD
MATIIDGARSSNSRVAGIYLAVLVVALVIVVVGTAIWLSTDNNPGTNALATDEKAITRAP